MVLQRQVAELGMKGFDIDGWSLHRQKTGCPLKKLILPLIDLVGVYAEPLAILLSVCSR